MSPRTCSHGTCLNEYSNCPPIHQEETEQNTVQLRQKLQRLNSIKLSKEIEPNLLLVACKNTSPAAIAQLIYDHSPAQALYTDSDGCTPLHWACRRDSHEVVNMLISKAPGTALMRDKYGTTPLQWACRWASSGLVKLVLSKAPRAVFIADEDGRLPIHWACRWNALEIVELLVEAAPCTLSVQDRQGWSPIHLACRWASEDVMRLIIETPQRDNTSVMCNSLTVSRKESSKP